MELQRLSLDENNIEQKVQQAMSSQGAFILKKPDINPSLNLRIYEACKNFHALSETEKMQCYDQDTFRGYLPSTRTV